MNNMASAFVQAASSTVAKIMGELHLPPESRTLRPIDVGGVAGGVKYLHQGQFFKVCDTHSHRCPPCWHEICAAFSSFGTLWLGQFALDEHGLFGSNVLASKGAGLELQALNELVATGISGINFTLMATVDYGGRRMSASSVLPINGRTICYGRCVADLCRERDRSSPATVLLQR